MSLNVILGASNTGKSEYIYREIVACENLNKQAILFVPSFNRVEAEKEYLKYTKKEIIIGTKITSIERYISQNIAKEKLYKDKTFLPEMSKKMLVKKVIMENPDMFKIFAKVKNTNGFADKIYDYVNKFKDTEIDNDKIIARYTNNDYLKAKLTELYSAYDKIEEILKEKFITTLDELNYFIANNSSKIHKDIHFFFDNYNNFSNAEFRFIESLLKNGSDVTITLDLDLEKYNKGVTTIYDMSKDTLDSLKELCAKLGIGYNEIKLPKKALNRPKDVDFLANHIFDMNKNKFEGQAQNVKLVLLRDTYNEIKFVANDILKKAYNGHRFSDFVVYTNSLQNYYIAIKKLFDLYNIPVYINEKQKLMDNSLVNYLLTALSIVNNGYGKSMEQVIALLKTGYIVDDMEQALQFENYVTAMDIKAYSLEKEFKIKTEEKFDEKLLNEVRQAIVLHINELKQAVLKCENSKQITEGIYNFLTNAKVIEKYNKKLNDLKIKDNLMYSSQAQAVAKLYEVMDNITLAYDKIDLATYIELLRFGINDCLIDTIPSKLDQVEICDINKSRGSEKRFAYIIGAYENGLPVVQNEDNIFTDIELNKLEACNIKLKNSSESRNNMQLFNIYQAISKVREGLVITVPSTTLSGSSLRPSSLVLEVADILNLELNSENIETININEKFMECLTEIANLEDYEDKEKLTEIVTKLEIYSKQKDFDRVINYIRSDKNLDDKTIKKIYKNDINSSVSKLEQFKRCPFAYYTKYVLNISDKRKFEMSKLDVGTFMHGVIEKISNFILAKNYSWQDVVLKENVNRVVMKQVEAVVDEMFEKDYYRFTTSARYVVLKNKLKSTMKRTITAIADSFNHSNFRPLGYEIEFEDGALYAPIQIELEDGRKLLLRGKIDRVDSFNDNENTYLRIVDYKSSDKNLKLSDVRDGLSLQLMTYMWALLENKDKISNDTKLVPAAVNYFTVSGKLLNLSNFESDTNKISEKLKKALKLKGIYISDVEVLNSLDNNMANSSDSYLEVSTRTLNNPEKVLPEEVFIQECKNMKNILKQIGDEIVSGCVKIAPNRNIDRVCDNCSYSSVCRKNILN